MNNLQKFSKFAKSKPKTRRNRKEGVQNTNAKLEMLPSFSPRIISSRIVSPLITPNKTNIALGVS